MKRRISPVLLLTAGLLLSLPACAISDLRPESLRRSGPTPELEQRGRELLAGALAASGGRAAWRDRLAADMQLTDEWFGTLGFFFRPWPENPTRLQVHFELGAPIASAEFLAGEHKGETWGREGARTWARDPAGEEQPGEGESVRFILAAYQYFFELPLRIGEAGIVLYAGTRMHDGREYELVFATWGQPEPHAEHDQYLLWIAGDTGRLEIVQYTIRDKYEFATGVNFFSDFRNVDGIVLPHAYRIYQKLDDARPLHSVQLEEVQFVPAS